tara:strand:+ start:87 stop:731 length:645 start_codon:yes stop_codon:yes gene_type:complete
MALSKVNFNSINATPTASKFVTFNSDADGLAAGDVGGALTLISTQTASSSSSLSFTSGIDSTYKEYVFKFINIHPATSNTHFQVNFRDGSTAFDAIKTTTMFFARHKEDDSAASLGYSAGEDIAQGTGYQNLYFDTGANASDESGSGTLHLFEPASTTFVKHFISTASSYGDTPREYNTFCAGYCNVTAAIDGVDFKMSSGNIDSGIIKMYGVS